MPQTQQDVLSYRHLRNLPGMISVDWHLVQQAHKLEWSEMGWQVGLKGALGIHSPAVKSVL